MILHGDYHTHTIHSDGMGTIEDNVKSAALKGLKQIALTEHGFSHMAYGLKRKQLLEYKKELDKAKKKYKTVDVLFGIEANIISLKGEIDITKEERKMFDVVIVGYHKSYKPISIKNLFNFFIPNTFNVFYKQRKKRIEKNTQAYINAIKNNDIDILAHLNYGGCQVNCVEIAKVAKEYDTYIELNGKRILFTDQELLDMQKTGVKFIVNSDAHLPENVGKNNKAFNLIERLNIPHEQVVNLNKVPTFKNYNKK